MGWVVKRMGTIGLAGLSGLSLALSFPPFGFAGLVWVGLIPLMVALWAGGGEKRRGWYGFRIGWWAGLVFWAINLKWIAVVSGLGVWAIGGYLAVYFGLWGAFAASAGNPWKKMRGGGEAGRKPDEAFVAALRSLGYAALNAGFWCGMEWVRGWMLTGFGWNGLGVSFHETPVIAQGAELVGVTGLSFLPVFLSGVLLQVAVRLGQEARAGRLQPHWDFGGTAIVLVAVVVFGIWKLQRLPNGEVMPLKVLMVQLNIPQDAKLVLWSKEEVHGAYEEETLKAFAELEEINAKRAQEAIVSGEQITLEQPDWVLWPESALKEWLFVTEEGVQAMGMFNHRTIAAVREVGNFTLLMGLNEVEALEQEDLLVGKEGGQIFNSLIALPIGADEVLSYRKHHLVIFGETIPYIDQLPFLGWLFEQSAGVKYTGSFGVGLGSEPLRLTHRAAESGEIAVIPSVCFEDTVPRLLRKVVLEGGQIIVNVTNDGWFKESEAAAQHFANARFRCIELRRPMVRCANSGVTAVVGVDGRVVDLVSGVRRVLEDEEGSTFTRGSLYATVYVPVDGELTLYARFGDWFAVVGLLGGILWIVTARLRRGSPSGRFARHGEG